MFTVEFEPDASVVTSLDETDQCEDIEMVIADNGIVFLRQFEESLGNYQLITITYRQLMDLCVSLQSTEGAFYVKTKT